MIRLHVFLCASPYFPDDYSRDQALHLFYLENQTICPFPDWVELTVLQNGCHFPSHGFKVFRNPFPKNIAYNWLVCDANSEFDYWMFLPEDCAVTAEGWKKIAAHIEQRAVCFALSKDPKAFICQKGIFSSVTSQIQAMCDINALGKEISSVFLRGELDRQGLYCLTKNWKQLSAETNQWGNELYQTMDRLDTPSCNAARSLPVFQDYGISKGWNASPATLEAIFMKVIDRCLETQRQAAEQTKALLSHWGPLITEVPYGGVVRNIFNKIRKL